MPLSDDDWWRLHDAHIAAWQADRQRLERLYALQAVLLAQVQAILARTPPPDHQEEEAGR